MSFFGNDDPYVCFSFFFWLRVLDKAEYSAFESTLNSPIVSYRIYWHKNQQKSWTWLSHVCVLNFAGVRSDV